MLGCLYRDSSITNMSINIANITNTHGLCMELGPISPWLIPISTLFEKVLIFTGS